MRKILKLVLGLLLVGSVVFGATPTTESKSLTLKTTVAGVLSTKITETQISTNANFQSTGVLSTKTVATNTEGLPTSTVFYFNIRTNITPAITVAVKATNFTQNNVPASPATASEISYTLSAAASGDEISDIALITSSSAPETFTTFYKYTKPDTGLKIDSRKITASLNTAEFAEANQDSYTATIIFNVTTT